MINNTYLKKLNNNSQKILDNLIINKLFSLENVEFYSSEEMFYKSIELIKEDFFNDFNENKIKSYAINAEPLKYYEDIIKNKFIELYNSLIMKTFKINNDKLNISIDKNEELFKKLKIFIKRDKIENLSKNEDFYIIKNNLNIIMLIILMKA